MNTVRTMTNPMTFSNRRIGIGERINMFDELDESEQTVAKFNEIFDECPFDLEEFPADRSVQILSPQDGNKRLIVVGSMVILKKMYTDVVYGMDRDKYLHTEKEDDELTEMYGYEV